MIWHHISNDCICRDNISNIHVRSNCCFEISYLSGLQGLQKVKEQMKLELYKIKQQNQNVILITKISCAPAPQEKYIAELDNTVIRDIRMYLF
jgi:hypothetical protein